MNTPQTLIAHLRNAETNHIGFSYNINTGDHNPDQGFMVSIKGYEETAPSGCDLIAFGRSYFLRHAEQLADPNYYMGCWVNAGRFVFDISENIQFLETAIQLGSMNNQEAIWDCASGSEYRLMREGDDEPEEVDYARPSYDDLYNFVDELMVEGDERATSILRNTDGNVKAYNENAIESMLHTLDVAMDEFNQLHNHSRSDDYYENHMTQLDNIINLINKLK
jgi:hypothetical protein